MTAVEPFRRLQNLEGLDDFEVRWPRDHGSLEPGLTSVLRV